MRNPIVYEIENKFFTQKELEKKIGINQSSVSIRLDSATNLDMLLRPKKESVKKYVYNGQRYNLDGLASISKISKHNISVRLSNGWSVKKAVETPPLRSNRKYFYKNENFTFSELSEIALCNKATLRTRLYRGWTVEKAVETLP